MSLLIVILILSALFIFVAVLKIVSHTLGEFEKGFAYLAWGVIALVVGASVYMTYATPTLASPSNLGSGGFTQDQSNLLSEE